MLYQVSTTDIEADNAEDENRVSKRSVGQGVEDNKRFQLLRVVLSRSSRRSSNRLLFSLGMGDDELPTSGLHGDMGPEAGDGGETHLGTLAATHAGDVGAIEASYEGEAGLYELLTGFRAGGGGGGRKDRSWTEE